MKKILLIAAVAGLSMVSCKKDYTCECTTTVTILGSSSSATGSTTIHDTKSKAKDACEKYNADDGVTKISCAIK